MNWEQVHVFFDVVSAIGSVVFFVIGLLIKIAISNLDNRLTKELNSLNLRIVEHDGVCDTDRKNLEYRLQSLEATRRRSL